MITASLDSSPATEEKPMSVCAIRNMPVLLLRFGWIAAPDAQRMRGILPNFHKKKNIRLLQLFLSFIGIM
jgi:hypothetical protein